MTLTLKPEVAQNPQQNVYWAHTILSRNTFKSKKRHSSLLFHKFRSLLTGATHTARSASRAQDSEHRQAYSCTGDRHRLAKKAAEAHIAAACVSHTHQVCSLLPSLSWAILFFYLYFHWFGKHHFLLRLPSISSFMTALRSPIWI